MGMAYTTAVAGDDIMDVRNRTLTLIEREDDNRS
jgi:hypothetical protein